MRVIHEGDVYKFEDGESMILDIEGKLIPVIGMIGRGQGCAYCPIRGECSQYFDLHLDSYHSIVPIEEVVE